MVKKEKIPSFNLKKIDGNYCEKIHILFDVNVKLVQIFREKFRFSLQIRYVWVGDRMKIVEKPIPYQYFLVILFLENTGRPSSAYI